MHVMHSSAYDHLSNSSPPQNPNKERGFRSGPADMEQKVDGDRHSTAGYANLGTYHTASMSR